MDENTKIVLLALIGVFSAVGLAWISYLVGRNHNNNVK